MKAGLRELRASRRIPIVQYKDENNTSIPKPRERTVTVEEEQPKKEKVAPKDNISSLMFDFNIKQDNLSDTEFESVKHLYEELKDPKRTNVRSIPTLMKDIGLTEEEKNLIVSEMRSMPQDQPLHVDTTHREEYQRLEDLLRDDASIMPTLDAWTKDVEKAIGKSISDPSKLTEEDFKKVPPAPQKLQDVIKFMMTGKQ